MKWYEVIVVILGIVATSTWIVLAVLFDGDRTNERRRRAEHDFAERRASGNKVNPHGPILSALAPRRRVATVAAFHALATLAIASFLASG